MKLSLSNISDVSQIFIAFANLILAGYVLIYQINKDKVKANETAKINEQNIKLQWFKELIVEPNMEVIFNFYNNLHTIRNKITSTDLTINEKQDINDFVKNELSVLRVSFIDILVHIDRNFADQILINLDELIDNITNAIFDDELKLNNSSVYEKNIGSRISYSKNNLIALLYNYKGVSS